MKRNNIAIAGIGLSILIMAGFSQPDRKPNRQDTPKEHRQQALNIKIDPDALRNRLNRSILHAQQMIERNSAALAKLDEGASPAEVLGEMRKQGIARMGNPDTVDKSNSREQQSDDQPRPMFSDGHQGRPPMVRPQAVSRFLEQNFPELWKNFEQIRSVDPKSADRLLGRMRPQIHEILILTKSQPDLAKIKLVEMKAGLSFVEASRVYRGVVNDSSSSEVEITEALASLRRFAEERFDAQVKSKLYEVQQLEVRLNELKASVKGIDSRRDQEVEQMIQSTHRQASKTRSQNHHKND